MELPTKIHNEIERLSAEGDELVENDQYREGIEKYIEALELIPEPKNDWQATTWLLTAIGDAHFLNGNFEYSMRALNDAMHCPEAIGNPFIHLRLGQCSYELQNYDKAADELTRAYMGAGAEIFENDDPKYFEFLKTKIKI